MWNLLKGYKTIGLSLVAMFAQGASTVKPEYAPICNTISVLALMGTPITLRLALGELAKQLSAK